MDRFEDRENIEVKEEKKVAGNDKVYHDRELSMEETSILKKIANQVGF